MPVVDYKKALPFLFLVFSSACREQGATNVLNVGSPQSHAADAAKNASSTLQAAELRTFEDLKTFITQSKISTIDGLLAKVGPAFNLHLVYKSENLAQAATKEIPRIILSQENAYLMLAAAGSADVKGGQFLEVSWFDKELSEFQFGRISFENPAELPKFEENPISCLGCHDGKHELRGTRKVAVGAHPIIESYPFWPGWFGSEEVDGGGLTLNFSEAKMMKNVKLENTRYRLLGEDFRMRVSPKTNTSFLKKVRKRQSEQVAKQLVALMAEDGEVFDDILKLALWEKNISSSEFKHSLNLFPSKYKWQEGMEAFSPYLNDRYKEGFTEHVKKMAIERDASKAKRNAQQVALLGKDFARINTVYAAESEFSYFYETTDYLSFLFEKKAKPFRFSSQRKGLYSVYDFGDGNLVTAVQNALHSALATATGTNTSEVNDAVARNASAYFGNVLYQDGEVRNSTLRNEIRTTLKNSAIQGNAKCENVLASVLQVD